MFNKKKNSSNFQWIEQSLYQYKILAGKQDVQKLIQQFVGEKLSTHIKIDTPYPLIKTLSGVHIEIGEVVIKQIELEKILFLLTSFVEFTNIPQIFNTIQNIDALILWAQENKLEVPDKLLCDGYICNNELITFGLLENVMTLEFKYKDNLNTPFIFYRLAFFATKKAYFMVQGKYF